MIRAVLQLMFYDFQSAFKLTNTVPLVALDALKSGQIDAHCLTNPKSPFENRRFPNPNSKIQAQKRSNIQTVGYWILEFGHLVEYGLRGRLDPGFGCRILERGRMLHCCSLTWKPHGQQLYYGFAKPNPSMQITIILLACRQA